MSYRLDSSEDDAPVASSTPVTNRQQPKPKWTPLNEKLQLQIKKMEDSPNHNLVYIMSSTKKPLSMDFIDDSPYIENIKQMIYCYKEFKTYGKVDPEPSFVFNVKGKDGNYNNCYFYITISGVVFSIHLRRFYDSPFRPKDEYTIEITICIGAYYRPDDEDAVIHCTIEPNKKKELHLDYFFYLNRQLTKKVIPENTAFLFYLLTVCYEIPSDEFKIDEFDPENLSNNFEKVKELLRTIKEEDLTKEQFDIDINMKTHIQSIGQRGMRLVKIIKEFTDTENVTLTDAWIGKGGENSYDIRRFYRKHIVEKELHLINSKIEQFKQEISENEKKRTKYFQERRLKEGVDCELKIGDLMDEIEAEQNKKPAIQKKLRELKEEIDDRGLPEETIKYWESKLSEQDDIGRPDSLASGFYGLFQFKPDGSNPRKLKAEFNDNDISIYDPLRNPISRRNPIARRNSIAHPKPKAYKGTRLNYALSKFTTRY